MGMFSLAFLHDLNGVHSDLTYASEIRIWTLEGDSLFTLSGHTSFVYSVTLLPDGKIASGGEDRTVRIWRGMYPVSGL